jgi:SAM-dependent methyltransferase
MEADYVAQYRRLYEHHWWWRSRELFLLDVIGQTQRGTRDASILDVGCGDGLFFEQLEEFGSVEGVESDPAAVDPRGRWASKIAQKPFDEWFDPGRRYSLILFLDVLEHVADPTPMLRRATELLEPLGSIIVTVPALGSLWTRHDDLNHHFRRYSKASFSELARRAGAREVRSAYFFHWLAPLKLGVRLAERLTSAEPRSPGLPPTWLNSLLVCVSRTEQRTLTRLPMPFGASLLVVLTRADPTS